MVGSACNHLFTVSTSTYLASKLYALPKSAAVMVATVGPFSYTMLTFSLTGGNFSAGSGGGGYLP